MIKSRFSILLLMGVQAYSSLILNEVRFNNKLDASTLFLYSNLDKEIARRYNEKGGF